MRRSGRRSDCPIHFGLEVFGDPWSLLIVRDLMFKARSTYTDFSGPRRASRRSLGGPIGAARAAGIVATERAPTTGRAVRYALTARGRDLMQ